MSTPDTTLAALAALYRRSEWEAYNEALAVEASRLGVSEDDLNMERHRWSRANPSGIGV